MERSNFFYNKMGMIELSNLGEMLEVDTYDQLSAQFKMVGPLLESMWGESTPSNLMDRLRTINDDEVKTVASSWAKIDEFHG